MIHTFWLSLGRVIWLGMAALLLFVYLGGVVPFYREHSAVCTEAPCYVMTLREADLPALNEIGFSLTGYALYMVGIELIVNLPMVLLGVFIFWQRRHDWMGLLISFALIMFGLNFMVEADRAFIRLHPEFQTAFAILTPLAGVPFLLILYLFPNGRFTPRWTRGLALLLTFVAFANPFLARFSSLTTEGLSGVYIYTYLASLIMGIGAQVYRYRTVSTSTERQQTKWIVLGFSVFVPIVLGWTIFVEILEPAPGFPTIARNILFFLVLGPFFWVLPIAVMFSIMKYRLWDIDFVIRRTLQYTLLTGLLALTYFGGVVVLQGILSPLTGSADSPLVTVITTLGIAALFNPLRHRVQDFIDRRFYRKKYDAEQALAQFAAIARDEVDMNKLSTALLDVVQETMQPEKVSLMLTQKENK